MMAWISCADRGVWQAVAISVTAHVGLACALGIGMAPQGSVQGTAQGGLARLSARLADPAVSMVVPQTPVPVARSMLTRPVPAQAVAIRKAPAAAPASPSPVADTSTDAQPAVAHAGAGLGGAEDPYADYLPAQDLDIIPMPVSAPDSRQLDGMALAELEVGVKLYVDATGQVQQVAVDVPDAEQSAANPLRAMFENTPFVPGRKDGRAVASILAIRIGIRDLGPVRHIAGNQ